MSASDDQLIEEICRRTEKLRLLRSLGPDQGLPLIPRSERLSRSAKTFTHDPANATVATRAAFTAEIETLQYNSEWSSRAIVTNQADTANISKNLEHFKQKSVEDARSMDARMLVFNERLTKTEEDVESLKGTATKTEEVVESLKGTVAETNKKTKVLQKGVHVLSKTSSLNSRNVAANSIRTSRLEHKTEKEFNILKDRLSKLEAEAKQRTPEPKVEEPPQDISFIDRLRGALSLKN
eukprot:680986_1